MKKILATLLVVCMMMTFASFPAMAEAANPYRVKIFTMGDSFTAGICEPNAYRYYVYEPLIQDGGVFEFIGPNSSGDFRVTNLYNKHGGVGGAIIGCADDYTWNGSGWSTNAWTYTNPNTGVTMKSNGNKNSIHYRLFAGSDGSNDYTKTEYGNYVAEADIVTLYIGLNDYYSAGATGISADIEHVKNRYYTIVDRIYEINPDVSLYVCSLNVIDYLRGYNLQPGDTGYDTSVFKFNEFVLTDVVAKYKNQGKKITGVSLNQPGYEMIVGVDNPSDDAHPNEKGNRKIGTQIYNAIKDEVLELNEQTGATYNPTRISSLTIDKTSATLKKGENLTITSTIAPSTAEIITTIFSSSDESVATVDGYGRITAVGAGTATIYATALDSMRPGATEIKQACNITVTDETYEKMGDNLLPVFVEDFSTSSAWTGNTEYIKGKAYKHDENKSSSAITSKKSLDLKEGFSISFKAALMGAATSEVNSANKNSQYVSVKVGNYEIRIAICGKVVSFYYNGELVNEKVFNVPVVRQNDDLYSLVKYQDTAYVYRNNELLFTSEVNKYDVAKGEVVLSVAGKGSKNIRDLQVKSIYGLQKLAPTAKNDTTNASAAVDGSTSTRYSIESGISPTAAEWTSSKNNVILDLGGYYNVSDLNIYWGAYSGGAWGKTMPDAYNVSYSNDGETYTPAKSYSGIHAYLKGEAEDTYTSSTTSFSASAPTWATGTDITTYSYGVVKESELGWNNIRYIKIEMTKVCYSPTIAEIEVYTTSYAPGEAPDGVKATYTVNYVDKEGNVLAESKTGTGYIDGMVSETAVEVKGYLPDATVKTLVLEDGENVITFVYTLVPEKLPLTADNVIAVKDWGWTNDGKLPDCTADALFDGEAATDTKGYFAFSYNPGKFATNANYIELDLGAVYDISHIIIQGGSDDWNYPHLLAYNIYIAGPDKEYRPLAVGKQDFGTSVTTANKIRTDTTDIKMNNVRYIKIVGVYGARRPIIGEIEVYRSLEENVERKVTTYTVNYVDTEGNTLADSKSGEGYVGDKVTESPVDISGYNIDEEPVNITLDADATKNVITFTYTAIDPNAPTKIVPIGVTSNLTPYQSATPLKAIINGVAYASANNYFRSNNLAIGDGTTALGSFVFEFATPVNLTEIWFNMGGCHMKYGKLYGSNTANDPSSTEGWTELHSFENLSFTAVSSDGSAGNTNTQSISHSGYYRYFKVEVTKLSKAGGLVWVESEFLANTAVESLGAQIRLPEADLSAGIRFGATVLKDAVGVDGDYKYDENATTTFGMFIIPKNLLGGLTFAEYLEANDYAGSALKVPAKKIISENDTSITYTAVLINIPDTAYTRDIVAIPYICANGVYTFATEETRNYAEVATSVATAYEKGEVSLTTEQKALIEKIIGKTLATPEIA